MFTNTQMDADALMTALIDNYFDNVRLFCSQDLPRDQIQSVQNTGTIMIQSLVGSIMAATDTKRQLQLFEQIQHRFMFVLRDYDRKWVWDLLGAFSEMLPEEMLH